MTIKLTMIGMHSVLTACTGMLSGVKSEIFYFLGTHALVIVCYGIGEWNVDRGILIFMRLQA